MQGNVDCKQRNLAKELIEIYTQESDSEGKPFGKYRLMFMIWPSINTTQLGMVAHLCNLATGELVLWIVGGLGSLGRAAVAGGGLGAMERMLVTITKKLQ